MKQYEHTTVLVRRAYDERSRDDGPDLTQLELDLTDLGREGWRAVGLTPGFVLLVREGEGEVAPAAGVRLPDPPVAAAPPAGPVRGPCRHCGLLLPALPAQRSCAWQSRNAWCEELAPAVLDTVAPVRDGQTGLACYGRVRDAEYEWLQLHEAGTVGTLDFVRLSMRADDGAARTRRMTADQARALAAVLLCFANRLSPRAAAALVTPSEEP